MDVHIFGIIFILILLPILYKIPIGLNKKEKLLIAGMSFILAEIGLLANKVLGIWKSIIILSLLALIAAYIFDTRLRTRFAAESVSSKRSIKEEKIDLSNDRKVEESIHKDFGDFNLGQEAIDRLLLEREQSKAKIDSIVLENIPSNVENEYQNNRTEHIELHRGKSFAEEREESEEQSGIIEDSYNNAEQFSDFAEVQQVDTSQSDFKHEALEEKEKDALFGSDGEVRLQLETEYQEEKSMNLEFQNETNDSLNANIEENEQLNLIDDLEKTDTIPMEQIEFEEASHQNLEEEVACSANQFESDRIENESSEFEQNDEIDLEDLLSGTRVENDRESLDEANTDSEDELLRRRDALFEELEEEIIVENPAFNGEDVQSDQSVEDVIENIEEHVEENVIVEEAVVEDVKETVIEDIVEDVKEDIKEDVQEIVEEMTLESIQENAEDKEYIVEDIKEDIKEYVVENVQESVVEVVGETELANRNPFGEIESELEPIIENVKVKQEFAPADMVEEIDENFAATESHVNVNYEEILDLYENISSSEMSEPEVKRSGESLNTADGIEDNQNFEHYETKTQQQLINSMLDNLRLSKQTLSPDEYANLVRSYLQPELPDQHYFTFAFLLIEHYISQQEFKKLFDLLQNLDSKAYKYPILKQQINYLIERYC